MTNRSGSVFDADIPMRALWIGLIAGWADAVGYLQAKTFAAQVTGNVVLLGIALAHRAWSESGRLLLVIAAFVAGMVMVLLISRSEAGRRAGVLACAAGMAAIAVSGALSPLMPLLSACLGGQNSSMQRFRGQSINTSFVSGDLQKFATALVKRLRGDKSQSVLLILVPLLVCSYTAGAAAGALATGTLAYPLLPAALLLPFALLLSE